jgi:hypothetical protein
MQTKFWYVDLKKRPLVRSTCGWDDNIVMYSRLAWRIIMGSGSDNCVYCNFFTIKVNYNSSHIGLLLNVCLTNLSQISDWNLLLLNSRMNSLSYLPRGPNTNHQVEQLIVLSFTRECLCLAACYLATTRSLLFIAAGEWLLSRCSVIDVRSGSTIPAFSHHVTILKWIWSK